MRFDLPDLGEGLHEAEIVAWHAGVGDHVVADQPLVSVETDKAVVEVPSPRSGRIARRFAEPGDVLQVGEPLVEFESGEHEDTGTVVGEIARPVSGGGEPARAAVAQRPADAGVHAAPAVRRRARELGVDLSSVAATGPAGSVSLRDVEAAAPCGPAAAWTPLRGPRRAMARNMARSNAEVAATTVTDDADVDAWPGGEDATARLVRALAAACAAEPALNAWFDGARDARLLHERLDLGIAVDSEEGLFVPVIEDAGRASPEALRVRLAQLREAVRGRTLSPAELRGATFTLSNFGMLGGRHAVLCVVPPQVAILGAGRIRQMVLVVDGTPAVRRVLPLSLTFDHRAVTGGEAARFLGALVQDLER
jgi:pyruvate dehydrogenase E2 component (dihydrolipoamide acetyltransferase)